MGRFARRLPQKLHLIWVDGGYRGTLLDWVNIRFQFALRVILRCDKQKGFKLLPRRRVVERTFAWLNHNRRLSKEYEVLPGNGLSDDPSIDDSYYVASVGIEGIFQTVSVKSEASPLCPVGTYALRCDRGGRMSIRKHEVLAGATPLWERLNTEKLYGSSK